MFEMFVWFAVCLTFLLLDCFVWLFNVKSGTGKGTGKVTIGTGYRYRTPRLPFNFSRCVCISRMSYVCMCISSKRVKLFS